MHLYGAETAAVLKSTKSEDFYQRALLVLYRLIARLRELNGHPTSLVPLCHASAAYIMIDTNGLYYLTRSVIKKSSKKAQSKPNATSNSSEKTQSKSKAANNSSEKTQSKSKAANNSSEITCPESNVRAFAANRLLRWTEVANIPTKLSRPNAAKNPESAGEKATRLADVAAKAAAAAANRQWTLDDFDREFVGIDLGRKTALVAKRLGNPGLKVNRRINGIDGLREWMPKTPTPRTPNSQETLDYLRYLYRSEYFREHMSLNLDIHTRIDRWSTYKQQQAAIAHICHCLTEGLDRKRATLCLGGATFNTSSRGHMASPTMRQLVDYLRRDGWHVITVWEFNTSQVCSRCHHELESGELPYKLCDVGSSADGHALRYKPTSNHFVKRCTRCRTIWNRDFNAALNIAYLGMLQYHQRQRPLHSRKGLSKPPACAARQMAQAAERAAAAFSSETAAPVAPETAETAVAPVAPATDVAPVAPVAPVDGAEAVLSNNKRRLLLHRETRKKRAKARRELRRAEVASITASPKDYIQRLATACPAPDPETERQKAYSKVKKGEEKRADKKEESKKSKVKVKRTADDSATAPDEPPSKKAKKTAPKK